MRRLLKKWGLLLVCLLIVFVLPADASALFKQGSFSTGTGTANISVTGVGFQPKVVILWTTASPGATGTDDDNFSFGVGISSTVRQAFWQGCLDNTDPSECDQRSNNALVLMTYRGTTPTLVGSLDFVSQDSDGFTVDPITAYAASATVFYYAIGGTDITNVGLATLTYPSGTPPVSFSNTTLGFQPNFLMLFGGMTTTNNVNGGDANFNIGFTDGTNSALYSRNARNGVASSLASYYVRSAAAQANVWAAIGTGSQNVNQRADFVSFDTNGFTLSAVENTVNGTLMFALAIRGGRWHVGDYTAPGATGNFSETGCGFQPEGLFLVHARATAQNTSDVAIARAIQTVGSATATTARGAASFAANDGVATNDEYSNGLSTAKIWYILNGAGTLVSDGDLVSFDSDGFTLNQTTFNSAFTFGIYFAMASDAPAAGAAKRRILNSP